MKKGVSVAQVRRSIDGVLLLVQGLIVVDLAAFCAAARTWQNGCAFLILGLYLSQISLAAIWLVLGSTWLPWRVMAALYVAISWDMGLNKLAVMDPSQFWIGLSFGQMLLVSLGLLPLRATGWRFAEVDLVIDGRKSSEPVVPSKNEESPGSRWSPGATTFATFNNFTVLFIPAAVSSVGMSGYVLCSDGLLPVRCGG